MNDPKRLQDLISSNALIDAFLGDPASLNIDEAEQQQEQKRQHGEEGRDTGDTNASYMTGKDDETGTDTCLDDRNNDNDHHCQMQQENEIKMILDSIASSHDVEALIDGIGFDLQYALDHSSLDDLKMMNDFNHIISDGNPLADENNANNILRQQTHISSTESNVSLPSPSPSPSPAVVTSIPTHLRTLTARISRVKTLLYNNDTMSTQTKSSSSPSSKSHKTSFIQHFLPMISSRNDDQNASSSTSSTTSYNAMNSFYNPSFLNTNNNNNNNNKYDIENSKIILDSILKNKRNKDIIVPTLLQYLHLLPFEIRKDVASIFNYLLVNSDCSSVRMDFVLYVQEYFNNIMDYILDGHFVHERENPSVSMMQQQQWQEQQQQQKQRGDQRSDNDTNTNTSGNSCVNNTEIKSSEGSNSPPLPRQIKTPDVALHCGSMLRSIIRHPVLYAQLVNDTYNVQKYIFPFLDTLVNQPTFEVASDALETLRLILHPMDMEMVIPNSNDSSDQTMTTTSTNHINEIEASTNGGNDDSTSVLLKLKDPAEIEFIMEKLSSSFLERDYIPIFTHRFNPKLLSSDHANYITRRVSLQLLSSILLTRSNYNIMIKYVSSKSNLRAIMMLLRDSSAHITFEAFNVFKIFVANPNKPPEVLRILADNKVKLIKYLTGLHREKEVIDEQFKDEKILVISTLEQLEI